jgi:adenosine deaminase
LRSIFQAGCCTSLDWSHHCSLLAHELQSLNGEHFGIQPDWRPNIDPVGTVTSRSAWVKRLPKIELHLHLEGSFRSETVRELSQERLGWSGPLGPGWENTYYTYTDFAGFMAQLTPRFPSRPDEYGRVAMECFEDLAARGVVYAEVSFDAPTRAVGDDTRFWPIVEVLEESRRQAEARWPIRINYIVGLMRTLPIEVSVYRVQLAAEARDRGVGIVAVDLHGDEVDLPPHLFLPAIQLAAERGLDRRAHAGEAMGPEYVWEAIDVLGVRRIGHGMRAAEDPSLIERLQEGDVTLEMSPTSNVRTGIVPDLPSHPIRRFFDLGIPVTVNSDDPLPFFTDIEREYRLLVDEFSFDRNDLREITLNAARAAFLSEGERRTLVTLIDGAYRVSERSITQKAL